MSKIKFERYVNFDSSKPKGTFAFARRAFERYVNFDSSKLLLNI